MPFEFHLLNIERDTETGEILENKKRNFFTILLERCVKIEKGYIFHPSVGLIDKRVNPL